MDSFHAYRKNVMILTAVFAFFSLASLASSLDISACGNLNAPNTYYKLTQNVESVYTCFNVTASNVTLDCQDFNVNFSTEQSGGIAVNITGQNDAVVKNCFLNATNSSVGSPTAIYLQSSNNSQFYNNTITANGTGAYGFWTTGASNNNTISNNRINDCYFSLYFDGDYNNTIDGNTINSSISGAFGSYLQTSVNDTFKNNIMHVVDSSYVFWLQFNSAYNNFRNNTMQFGDSSYGIYLSSSSNNVFNNNPITASASSRGAVINSASNNNTISNSMINFTGMDSWGIQISGSNYSTISNCVINGLQINYIGLYTDYSAFYNTFSNNTVENFTYGVYNNGGAGFCQCPGLLRRPVRYDNKNVFDKITIKNSYYGYYVENPPIGCTCFPFRRGNRATYHTYDNTFSNSIITNTTDAIYIDSSDYCTLTNNIITNTIENAISLNDVAWSVSFSTISGNTINNASYCIYLHGGVDGVYNNSFYNNRLASCDYGLTLEYADSNVFADSTIGQSNVADVYAPTVDTTAYSNTFISTTFNKSNITLNNGAIFVQWYLRTRVVDTGGSGIENAEVNITDASDTLLYTLTTSADGYAQTQNVSEYWQDPSDFENYTPHTISAKINPSASTTTELTENREVTLQLDYQAPAISNVHITDVTQNTITIAWDTNKPANETVEYGADSNYGTNYTNGALATTHSAVITGLNKAATYHYKIHACGTVNCGNTSDYNFTTLIEGTGYGGGAGGGAFPTASPTASVEAPSETPSEAAAAPSGAPQAPGGEPAGVTPQASEAPSVEAPSPSTTPQPTGAGINMPFAVALTLVLAGAAYFVATQGGFLKKK